MEPSEEGADLKFKVRGRRDAIRSVLVLVQTALAEAEAEVSMIREHGLFIGTSITSPTPPPTFSEAAKQRLRKLVIIEQQFEPMNKTVREWTTNGEASREDIQAYKTMINGIVMQCNYLTAQAKI